MAAPVAGEPEPAISGGAEAPPGGSVVRRRLGSRLRRLRHNRGVGLEEAAGAVGVSMAKLCRLERGQGVCKQPDIEDLLTFYQVDRADERQEYLDLVRDANTPSWWQLYDDVIPAWAENFLGLEEAATVLRGYAAQRIPDLLQTPGYARALAGLQYPCDAEPLIERRVDLIQRRQEALTRPDPPRSWLLVDEAALRRPVGGRPVMRAQIEHLMRLHSELPTLTVQVVPLHAAAAALLSSLSLLRFADPDLPDVVYREHLTGAVYVDKTDEIDHYRLTLDKLTTYHAPNHTLDTLRHLLRTA